MFYQKVNKAQLKQSGGWKLFQLYGREAFDHCRKLDPNLQSDAESFTVPTLMWLNHEARRTGFPFTFVESPENSFSEAQVLAAARAQKILVAAGPHLMHDLFFHWVPLFLILPRPQLNHLSRMIQIVAARGEEAELGLFLEMITPLIGNPKFINYEHPQFLQMQQQINNQEFNHCLAEFVSFLEYEWRVEPVAFDLMTQIRQTFPQARLRFFNDLVAGQVELVVEPRNPALEAAGRDLTSLAQNLHTRFRAAQVNLSDYSSKHWEIFIRIALGGDPAKVESRS